MADNWLVEFYVDDRGRLPAYEFLSALPAKERAKMLRVIDLLQEFGVKLGMPHAKPIEGMWELRAGAGRLFYVAVHGQRFIVLHGYRKKSQSAPRKEIDTAKRRWALFVEREENE